MYQTSTLNTYVSEEMIAGGRGRMKNSVHGVHICNLSAQVTSHINFWLLAPIVEVLSGNCKAAFCISSAGVKETAASFAAATA